MICMLGLGYGAYLMVNGVSVGHRVHGFVLLWDVHYVHGNGMTLDIPESDHTTIFHFCSVS
jgi:hypothetical protein